MTRDYRADLGPLPPRDTEAFHRAKEQVEHALELRRQARTTEPPIDESTTPPPLNKAVSGE